MSSAESLLNSSKVIRIGDIAPNFKVAASTDPNFEFYPFIEGSWAILFSHPADFTPVCTTELGAVQKNLPEFKKRNVKVCGISADVIEKHHGWIKDINETQHVEVSFPMVADATREVSVAYGMLDKNNIETSTGLPLTVRNVFFH